MVRQVGKTVVSCHAIDPEEMDVPVAITLTLALSHDGLTGIGKTDLQLRSGPVSLSFRVERGI